MRLHQSLRPITVLSSLCFYLIIRMLHTNFYSIMSDVQLMYDINHLRIVYDQWIIFELNIKKKFTKITLGILGDIFRSSDIWISFFFLVWCWISICIFLGVREGGVAFCSGMDIPMKPDIYQGGAEDNCRCQVWYGGMKIFPPCFVFLCLFSFLCILFSQPFLTFSHFNCFRLFFIFPPKSTYLKINIFCWFELRSLILVCSQGRREPRDSVS